MHLNYDDLPAYAFLDPASGRKARNQGVRHTRSRSAIVVAKAEQAMGRIFVVNAWAGRVPPSAIVDKVIEVNEAFRPCVFGIESSGQQYLFAETLGVGARLRGAHIPWMPVDQPTTIMKDDRIRNTIQPLMQAGRLFIDAKMHELIAELEGFPTAMTKDLVDALASVIYHLIPAPRPAQQDTGELDALAAYLRGEGYSPSYIAERLAQAAPSLDSSYSGMY